LPGGERPKAPWLDAAEIKRQVPIESVLEAYGLLAGLTRRGSSLVGASPFREGESAQTFSVSVERGIWNDGTGRPVIDGREVPGNVIGLLQALEKCSFREALEKLHERFLAVSAASPEESAAHQSRGSVQAALRQERVQQREEGNKPFGKELGGLRFEVPWLQDTKGITVEAAKAFGVGYCSRGMMKGRIVFPIRRPDGELVAYAGRSLKEDDPAGKYRFPSGFVKHHELFNIDRLVNDEATRAIVAEGGIVVVKGFTDVLRLHQNGVPNAVALMGNDFGERQIEMLLEHNPSRKVTLFLDNDEAGNVCRRRLAAALIHRAYIRYPNYAALENSTGAAPQRLTKEELGRVLC
jgi:DNA primase